jgi:phospholipid/cholesterol/gamma-HCH transport system substrate-binding protein
MPRSTTWRALWPGLVLLGGLVAGIVWVFVYARIGALRGDTYRLYSVTSEARGVLKGTEVWLGGQRVGQVKGIAFRPPSTDTTDRLLLELAILEEYRDQIRADSRGQIRSGGTLIGQPVVSISVGSIAATPLSPDDTLPLGAQGDTEGVASRVAAASRVFPDIAQNARSIRDQFLTAGGTLGQLDEEAPTELRLIGSRARELTRDATGGEGTLALALGGRRSELMQRVNGVLARTDTLRTLLASEQTSLGRFRRDTTLARSVAALRDDVSIIRALLDRADGTAGRLMADAAIQQQLAQLERELDTLLDDIRRRPLRYLPF